MDLNRKREQRIQRIILIEGSANLVVLIAKLAVGLSTGSLAVLGDALHSLSDMINNIVAWLVVRVSAIPADREHPYGHRKFETLAVFGLAALLAAFGLELALHAVSREPAQIASGHWEVGLMLGVLCVNIVVAAWQRHWARRLKSDILLADASHTFSDVLVTLTVIAGWQFSAIGHVWLDQACAIGVAALILYLAWRLFQRAAPVLVDRYAIEPERLKAVIREIEGVDSIIRVRSRWIGPERAVDMVICVQPSMSTARAHDIADEIEAALEAHFDIRDVSIHIEPVITDDT